MRYEIDYGFGRAYLDTPYEDAEARFYKLANTCFGIRKSIMYCNIISKKDMPCEYFERLYFDSDEYIWREDGARKMISPWLDEEWDTSYCEECRH